MDTLTEITATLIDRPVPAGWAVKNCKTLATHDGYAYTCTLYVDGKRVAYVEQSGQGGCNMYSLAEGAQPRIVDLMATAAECLDDTSEPLDTIVARLMDDLDTLKAAKRYAKKTGFPFVGYAEDAGQEDCGYMFAVRTIDRVPQFLAKHKAARYRILIGE